MVPQERVELSKALLLRQVGVPVSISHRGMLVVWEGFEPPRTSRPAGYSRVPCQIGVHTDGGLDRIRTCNNTSFEEGATTNCATSPEIIRVGIAIVRWSGRLDSNQRHLASKARTLTGLSYAQCRSVVVD